MGTPPVHSRHIGDYGTVVPVEDVCRGGDRHCAPARGADTVAGADQFEGAWPVGDDRIDVGLLLRQLRRREARQRHAAELTYRELAARTGWSLGIVGQYFSGKTL